MFEQSRHKAILLALLFSLSLIVRAGVETGEAAYREGRYGDALASLQPLAEAGDPQAQYLLGIMYARGEGVQQDFYVAGKLYRRAAEQGHSSAQVNLGSLLENCYGNGACNSEDAAVWYREAANQGNPVGQYNLAIMYATGDGVAENEWDARLYCRRAAEQGYLPAQFNLGVFYARGMGGPVDKEAAWAWYETAAQRGFEGALEARDQLASGMASEQLVRAESLAERLLAAYGG